MRNHTCLLDRHQRSHYDTITIGPEGMINWALRLNNSQLENSLNSVLEKHHVLSFPNQPIPNPIQSVIDRGNLRTQNVCLLLKVKRPVHKRSMINVCKKNLVLQIEQGKPVKSEDIRVMHAHDGTGEPVKSSASTHTVEEFVPAEHRDTASSNANKFNLATDEENIDFNIPGVPNSMVKRSHGVNVHNLIQKIENHPQRQVLQSDLQQHRPFNLSAENHKMRSKLLGTLNCAR